MGVADSKGGCPAQRSNGSEFTETFPMLLGRRPKIISLTPLIPYPLKIDGWKMIHVLLKWPLFKEHNRSFSGGWFKYFFQVLKPPTPWNSFLRLMTWSLSTPGISRMDTTKMTSGAKRSRLVNWDPCSNNLQVKMEISHPKMESWNNLHNSWREISSSFDQSSFPFLSSLTYVWPSISGGSMYACWGMPDALYM